MSVAPDEVEDVPQLCRTESRCLSAASPEPSRSLSAPFPLPDNVRVESRPYDSTQEVRAMILTALPLPPLPVVVQNLEDDGRVGAELVQTSHDILSNLLLHACAMNDAKRNQERKRRQQEVLRSLVHHMCCRGQLQPIPELYETYCHHTRLHMSTYVPPEAPPLNIRFAPLASVCRGDPTHLRMCDYMAGQAVILDEPNGRCAQDWLCREYADMLALARGRLLSDPGPFREEADDEDIFSSRQGPAAATCGLQGSAAATPGEQGSTGAMQGKTGSTAAESAA